MAVLEALVQLLSLLQRIWAHMSLQLQVQMINSFYKVLGADKIIDYKSQDFEVVSSDDYDAVYDTVGGQTYTKSFNVR